MAERLTTRRPRAGRRRIALIALVLVVATAHVGLTGAVAERMVDASAEAAMPPRIEVAYVQEMALAAPPPVAAPAAPVAAPAPQAPLAAESAASAPEPTAPEEDAAPSSAEPASEASAPETVAQADAAASAPPEPAASEPAPAPAASEPAFAAGDPASAPASSAPPAAVTAAAEPASASSAAAPFEWPASTRVSYTLTGNYRGEITGEAQVEWVHAGPRYQVHLDILVGMPFAPLLTRKMSSDGEITPQGLRPTRFDQDSKVAFRDRQRLTMHFEPDAVVLANGDRRERPPGVQDTASQFVQMTYLFATTPGLLAVGGTVEFPLALPRKVDRWVYDVVGEEPVYTTFGTLDTFHLVPRPPPTPTALTAEIWFAPQLRHLPVRIRIRQDEQTFIDLVISRRPQLAAAP